MGDSRTPSTGRCLGIFSIRDWRCETIEAPIKGGTYIPHFLPMIYWQFLRVISFEITSDWHLGPDPDREAL